MKLGKYLGDCRTYEKVLGLPAELGRKSRVRESTSQRGSS